MYDSFVGRHCQKFPDLTNPVNLKKSRLAEGCHMGCQGQVFIKNYSEVSGSGGRCDFILTYGDCSVGGMFSVIRLLKENFASH